MFAKVKDVVPVFGRIAELTFVSRMKRNRTLPFGFFQTDSVQLICSYVGHPEAPSQNLPDRLQRDVLGKGDLLNIRTQADEFLHNIFITPFNVLDVLNLGDTLGAAGGN